MANHRKGTSVIDQILPWDADYAAVDAKGELIFCTFPENPTCVFCCGTGVYRGKVCRRCNGVGHLREERCPECNGESVGFEWTD